MQIKNTARLARDIKRLRKERGYTLRQFHRLCEQHSNISVSHSQISRLENNKMKDPSMRLVAFVASGFRLSVDDLIREDEELLAQAASVEGQRILADLEPSEKDQAIRMLKAFKESVK